MPPGPSPLLGYNTNVRHKGKLYHIQTEDSGINHPHIITHLFADGGRVIKSHKRSYQSEVKRDDIVVLEVMVPILDREWWHEYRKQLERLFRQDKIVVRAQAYEIL